VRRDLEENADLTGVNLQGELFLQRANLRARIFPMADFAARFAGAGRSRQRQLLGAELRGANLMGATLYGVEGLWLGRLGGANFMDANAPRKPSSSSMARRRFGDATRTARWFYLADASVCVLCAAPEWLRPPTPGLIWTAKR